MGWATAHIDSLRRGEAVQFRPRGNSMAGKINSGLATERVTLVTTTVGSEASLDAAINLPCARRRGTMPITSTRQTTRNAAPIVTAVPRRLARGGTGAELGPSGPFRIGVVSVLSNVGFIN